MMRRGIATLLIFIGFCLFIGEAKSTVLFKPLATQELTEKSSLIIVGIIIKTESSWNAERTKIFTFLELDVEDYIKGQGDKTLTVRVPGGTADGITEEHSGNPTFSVGEKVLLFLNPGHPYSDIVGAYQGKYTIVGDNVLGKDEPASEFIRQLKIMVGKEPPESKILENPENEQQEPTKLTLDIPLSKDAEPIQFYIDNALPATSYNLVMSQNFEGSFPTTGWTASSPNCGPYWGVTAYKSYSGSKSAWCARGGSYGVDPYNYPYPNNVNSWIIYGPFSLTNIQNAFLQFYYWNKSEPSHDYFKWMVSIDGKYFYGPSTSGDSGGWKQLSLDLTNVPVLGNVCGQPYVWLAFIFQSDTNGVVDQGTYVDDISLYVSGAPPPPSITSVSPSSASAGTNSMVTINGNDFGSNQGMVHFRAIAATGPTSTDNPNAWLPAIIISWSNSQIKCDVPTDPNWDYYNYSYSAGSFNNAVYVYNGQLSNGYPFSVTFGYSGQKWATNTLYYYINENATSCTGEGSEVQAATNTWSSNSNFNFIYVGQTASISHGQNGKNEIVWGDLGAGKLGGSICWSSGGNIYECDIVFNVTYSWSTSGIPSISQFDVQTLTLHELGHWLKLLDLYGDNDSNKVMYGFNGGEVKRTLNSGDISGIQYIYGSPQQKPNLTPYQPQHWSDKIIISVKKRTSVDSASFYSTDILYLDWAVINNGSAAISLPFESHLYIDGVFTQAWQHTKLPLNTNAYQSILDYPIGPLISGTHTVKIATDGTGIIDESNESDNEYTKTITILPAGSDLTGSWTVPIAETCKTSTMGVRCTIKGTFTLNNQGNRNSTSTYINFYLSDDDTYYEGDYLLKSVSTGNMRAAMSKAIRLSINLPVGENASGKYVIAVIDPDNVLTELDETNNVVVYGPIQ